MDSGVLKIGFCPQRILFTLKKYSTSHFPSNSAFLTVLNFFLRREAFFDQNKKKGVCYIFPI
jgi:hypothetical protein